MQIRAMQVMHPLFASLTSHLASITARYMNPHISGLQKDAISVP